MKEVQKLLLLLLFGMGISFQFPQLNSTPVFEIQPAAAVDIPTVTTIHPNRTMVWPGETLQLTVHVVMEDRQGIEIGLVTISDLNNSWSQDYPLQPGSEGKLVVFVDIPTVTITGKHVLQAVYQGHVPSSYLASSATTIVEFLSGEPAGVEPATVTVQLDAGTVFTNESFTVTVNVTTSPQSPPFFGGTIGIAVPTEEIVLTTYIIPSGFYFEISVALNVTVPLWFTPGLTNLTAEFIDTGGTYFPASTQFTVDILGVGHQLALTVTPDPLNRVDDTATIRVDFAGDNATGKLLQVGWTEGVTNWTIATRTVTNNPEIIPWTANYSFTPGSYNVWAELRNPGTGTVYATYNQTVSLIDYVALNWQVNSTDLAPGDTVEFSFTSSQEDIPTIAVPSQITINDSAEGVIGNVVTDSLGLGVFSWAIPAATPGGIHALNFTVQPLNASSGIIQKTFWGQLTLQGQTQIQLVYPAQIQRGQLLEVDYQLSVENQDPVTEGQLYFNPPNDPLQVQDVNATGSGQFALNISLNHPVGTYAFPVTYGGTTAFSPANTTANITVLAQPHFDVLHINGSPVLPGQTLRIFGQLLDEVDQGVPDQTVLFYLSGSIGIGSTTTNGDGTFALNWVIPANASPGLNIISAEFPGNLSAGYLPPLNQPVTTAVLISNNVALEVPTIIIINTSVTLKVHGGFGTNVSIWWRANGSVQWEVIIQNLTISAVALPTEVTWNVPDQRGPITFRLTNSLNITVFTTADAYEDPQYTFPTDFTLLVDEDYTLNASASASYRILVDGIPATIWQTTATSFPVAFALRGLHTITLEISEAYVVAKTITTNVTVYESVTITILAPANITANSTAMIDITVVSSLPGGQPLSGKNVAVILHDVTRSVTIAQYYSTLDAGGEYQIETDALFRGSYEVEVQLLAGQDWFAATSERVFFYAVGRATLEVTLPSSFIYGEAVNLSASLQDDQGPLNNQTISLWWREGTSDWSYLGENSTTATGEVNFTWIPLLQPGKSYEIKVELATSPDLERIAVIKPMTLNTLPPAIVAVHSLLPSQVETITIAPRDYEVVVEIAEKSPLGYAVYLAVNSHRINMSRVDGAEWLIQNGSETYVIPANGHVLYVGTISCVANGLYNVVVEAEDSLGATSVTALGSFSIEPPTVQDIWSLLPETNSSLIAADTTYAIVAQVQEYSPMNYSLYLVVNGHKTSMSQEDGVGYTLQAPNGTTYFIPANTSALYVGLVSFSTNGTYDLEILLEDERGVTQSWQIGIFQVTSPEESSELPETSDDDGTNNSGKGSSKTLLTSELIVVLLLMLGSSGTVVIMGRPRRAKI
ncbi:MAG: hypothetical protein ACE5OZ_21900 [Candidatus Heimdallarchaeota archaeon]